ncbi:kef-type k+ transport membrane component [Leptolyngbya sp. Heron Island J]|uniref:cation:proton antiporter n=1 Tax=Leptolyngbya sp. Heron Island J TaxID=1385935 RepID=UPI0003B990AB|nr:cation:proton antiporter [Leptolyngbya sp. Heron Island J]ESA33940.1 kef-type k+ transport membrane component [Leptolyngbya sp. Heron Island J]
MNLTTFGLTPFVLADVGEISESVIFFTLLLSAIVIFSISYFCEEVCTRLRLSPVLGQLISGIILGVSALKILVFTDGDMAINPMVIDLICQTTGASTQEAVIAYSHQLTAISEGVANLGVIALLFVIGLESDLDHSVKVGPQAAIVAGAGVVLPFIGGTVGLMTLFSVATLPAIFGGAALTATSIGITAKILKELGHLQSEEGQIIIGAAVLDDLLGILILAVVVSLVKDGSIDVANLVYLLLGTTVFVAAIALLRTQIAKAFDAITQKFQSDNGPLLLAILLALAMAAIANIIHLEAILGAFAAGIILSGTRQQATLLHELEPVTALIAPVFFIVVGAKTDLSVLNPANPGSIEGLWMAAFLIVVAVIGKVTAGYLIPSAKLNRLAIGIGMVPRGEVGLVFVGIGASVDILSNMLTAAVILTVVVTTLIAPVLLPLALPNGIATEQKA